MDVIAEIAAERHRQINIEGWSADHDDKHVDRSLAKAAASYAYFASLRDYAREGGQRDSSGNPGLMMMNLWPVSWARKWWKPKTHRRDLIRAAALIVAEIERLDRMEPADG